MFKKDTPFLKEKPEIIFVQNHLKNDGARYLESYFNFEDFF